MPQSQARLAPAQYSFAPAQKQITFAGVPGFTLDGLVLVVNAASGKVIFDPQDSSGALGGTASGSTVTLAYDTTAMSAADRLVVIYNSLERDDQLFTFSPTTTGPLAVMAVKSFMSAMVDIQSTTGCSGNLEGTVDNTQWKAIKGQLPNLDSNTGDTNFNEGKPFNMRQCDVTPYRLIRFNVTSIAAGSPAINILLKTVPAPPRLFIANGGSLVANFDSGGSVGYVRQTSLFPEVVRGTLQSGAAITTGSLTGGVLSAGAVVTGGTRQANGQPNPYYSRFGARVNSDQSGALQIQDSTDGTNWIPASSPQTVTAGIPLDLEVKVRAPFCRAVFTNGNAPTGANAFSLLAAFCGA
ncbi:hypothetical protein [Methylobacterium brachiatum]|uniref:hypothetical protein n=1 Tax=Methylobacterium brachiatum TaxID=269660 RepID=UPI0008DFCCF1|nr:hypothetical protein [Methylobacterium brachiatum]SFJ67500.1 hypothetical protein SAMN02799642_05126 [Methylobacterium brachiatum]